MTSIATLCLMEASRCYLKVYHKNTSGRHAHQRRCPLFVAKKMKIFTSENLEKRGRGIKDNKNTVTYFIIEMPYTKGVHGGEAWRMTYCTSSTRQRTCSSCVNNGRWGGAQCPRKLQKRGEKRPFPCPRHPLRYLLRLKKHLNLVQKTGMNDMGRQ